MSTPSMFLFTSNAIHHRPCGKCRAPMTFMRSKPARMGFDLHTFECSNCNNVETITAETIGQRWINGLTPPM